MGRRIESAMADKDGVYFAMRRAVKNFEKNIRAMVLLSDMLKMRHW